MNNKLEELKQYVGEHKLSGAFHCQSKFTLRSYSDSDIFYSLAFCILVPAGNARRTSKAVQILKNMDYYENYLTDVTLYDLLKSYVRFPSQKAHRLSALRRSFKPILKALKKYQNKDSKELREFMVSRVSGLGYKAASHFLRNMGFKDLAIIDTHILKYREYFMPEKYVNYRPTSKKRYLILEEYFNKWAGEEFGLGPFLLDWLIWCKESNNSIDELDY